MWFRSWTSIRNKNIHNLLEAGTRKPICLWERLSTTETPDHEFDHDGGWLPSNPIQSNPILSIIFLQKDAMSFSIVGLDQNVQRGSRPTPMIGPLKTKCPNSLFKVFWIWLFSATCPSKAESIRFQYVEPMRRNAFTGGRGETLTTRLMASLYDTYDDACFPPHGCICIINMASSPISICLSFSTRWPHQSLKWPQHLFCKGGPL